MNYSLALILLSLLTLSACSSGKDKPRVKYHDAASRPALQLPNGLTQKKEPTAFVIPELKSEANASAKVSDYPPTLSPNP